MQQRLISLLVFLTIGCTLGYGLTVQEMCDERGSRQHDEDTARLLTIGQSGRKFPVNNQELKTYCAVSNQLLVNITRHKDVCLKNLANQVSSVMIYTGKSWISRLCTPRSRASRTLLEISTCANHGAKEIQKCYEDMVDGLLGVLHEVDIDQRIPMMCCGYFGMFPCMEKTLKNVQSCDERKIDTLTEFVKGIIGNAVNLICGDYTDDSDKCKAVGSPPMKKSHQKRPKSFAYPMIDVLDSILGNPAIVNH